MDRDSYRHDYERGFNEQMRWLTGGPDLLHGPSAPKTLDEANECLAARLATVEPMPYNEGADDATRLYIERVSCR